MFSGADPAAGPVATNPSTAAPSTVTDRAAPFRAEVHHERLGSLQLLHFAYGAAVRIASAPLEDFLTVHVPLRGVLAVEHGGARVRARVGPRSRARVDLDRCGERRGDALIRRRADPATRMTARPPSPRRP